ncbi:MAG: 50S ribosomal protein L15 [Dehalococcoidia bacterium]|jgi:large subunit ribosomal protein L15|nr:50S ribosomal protein L15 [Dehalococcoidia bacterium]
MRQHDLGPKAGSKRGRKRVGRGDGSGHGTYSCRGCKGQKSRSGGGVGLRFEGGQTPLVKRLPALRGFTNIFKTDYALVNLHRLRIFEEGIEVTPQRLLDAGLVSSLKKPIKVLGDGELQHPLVVRANKFSQTAKKKIEASGGKAEEI